ncbi:MAG TPA: TIGR04222 domain-containing membrane protein [Thermomonospora sp.]|nr:TIGR04222 domain-containing membrane protein [Thermomonospora sp.]
MHPTVDRLAGSGDTWGISGPAFLTGYVVVAVLFFVGALVARRRITAGGDAGQDLHPYEVAYLVGGRFRTIATALAGLRADGAVTAPRPNELVAGPEPTTMRSPLDLAIHREVQRDAITVRSLSGRSAVWAEVDAIRLGLEKRGLLPGPAQRAQVRLAALPMALLLVAGFVRLLAGLQNDRPVGFLVVALIIVAVATAFLLMVVPDGVRAGDRAVELSRTRHRHLDPSMSPAWTTYGAEVAALGVALYGVPALAGVDPEFADAVELHKHLADGGGSSASSGSASSGGGYACSGGGSSCGGGGGGGGGCGGGGCGG